MTRLERGHDALTVVDGTAPGHDGDETRVILSPGALTAFDGSTRYTPVAVLLGRPDGSVVPRYNGTDLARAKDAATTAVRECDPAVVRVRDRSRLRADWSPSAIREVVAALAEAAADRGATVVVFAGHERADSDASASADPDASASADPDAHEDYR